MGAESEAAEPNQTTVATSPEDVEALLDAARYGDLEDLMILATAVVPLGSTNKAAPTFIWPQPMDTSTLSTILSAECNLEKNTPLHWACLNGYIQVVKNLILAGADASLLNSLERTPVDEAVSRGKMEVIDAINTAAAQLELVLTAVS